MAARRSSFSASPPCDAPPVFQVEPILWLQEHGGSALRFAMEIVSWLGRSSGYAAALIVLAHVRSMRRGLALVLLMLASAVVIDGIKTTALLPRPEQVDDRVLGSAPALVARGGAPDPWSPLPTATIAATREATQGAVSTRDRGFPSGHVASATVFALGVHALLPWRGAGWFAALWIPLMALSRLTSGKHFVADVIGGLVIGVALAWLGTRIAHRVEARPLPSRLGRRVLLGIAGLAWIGAAAGIGSTPRMLGSLAGAVLGLAWLGGRAPLEAEGPGWRSSRAWLRAALAALIYGVGMQAAAPLAGLHGSLVDALAAGIPVMLALALPPFAGGGPKPPRSGNST